jgi:hypothetical protein
LVFLDACFTGENRERRMLLADTRGIVVEVFDNQSLRGLRFEERFLNLGVDQKFTVLERDLIKVQVKNFIPPLLVPAIRR